MVSKVNLSMMTMAKMNLKMKDKNDAFGRSAIGNDMMTLAGFNKLVQKESFAWQVNRWARLEVFPLLTYHLTTLISSQLQTWRSEK